ncbi:hypothetical protein QAD02_009612 [Eretmocerus hayati]|uniref:Uncharacterized protein n=1 Tax=Eretmocerus hayati TaxID=131215 RepID=A0ACC2NA65_9HYME|nr:hypothetical protein QAD02_009612 [Eretmocerus hayati]
MQSGIQKKEDRQKILDDIPHTGVINLEAPTLNEGIASQLNTKELSRDNFFKLYQAITGSTISLASSMIQSLEKDVFSHTNVPQEVKDNTIELLSNIIKLNSDMYQMMCIRRKHFLVGGFQAKTKKALARARPTQFLFGGDIKSLVDGANSLERSARVMKPKNNQATRGRNLNSQRTNYRDNLGNGSRFRQNYYAPNRYSYPREYRQNYRDYN